MIRVCGMRIQVKHIRRLSSPRQRAVISVAFSPNGNTVVTASESNSIIRLWDVKTGEHIYALSGHTEPVYSVAFSPDGKTIVSGSVDKTLRLWDVETILLRVLGPGFQTMRLVTAKKLSVSSANLQVPSP